MKKCTKILLALLLITAMVFATACTSSELKTPASVDNGIGNNSGSGNGAANTDNHEQTEPAQEDGQISIAEAVLYEKDDVKVTVTGMDDSWMGPQVKLLIENNGTKNLLLTAEAVSVNGYMMPSASLYAEVAAGKKANEGLSFMDSELEQSGITTIAQIQLAIRISDADSWDTLTTSDLITLETSAAGYQQNVDDSGDVLYEGNDIKVVCKGLKQDVIWDGTVVFYIENNNNQPITVYAENVSVNGFMVDVGMWSDLRPGTRIVDGMYLMDMSDLELSSIDEVENIEFTLRIINADNWDEIVTTDAITLNFA